MNSQIICVLVILSRLSNDIVSAKDDDKTDIKTIRDALITFLDKLHSMNKKLDMPTAYKELKKIEVKKGSVFNSHHIKNDEVDKEDFKKNYIEIVKHSCEAINLFAQRIQTVQIYVDEKKKKTFDEMYEKLNDQIKIKEKLDERESQENSLSKKKEELEASLKNLAAAFDHVMEKVTTIKHLKKNAIELIHQAKNIIIGRLFSQDLYNKINNVKTKTKLENYDYYISTTENLSDSKSNELVGELHEEQRTFVEDENLSDPKKDEMMKKFQEEYIKLVDYCCEALTELNSKMETKKSSKWKESLKKLKELKNKLVERIRGRTNEGIETQHKKLKETLERFWKNVEVEDEDHTENEEATVLLAEVPLPQDENHGEQQHDMNDHNNQISSYDSSGTSSEKSGELNSLKESNGNNPAEHDSSLGREDMSSEEEIFSSAQNLDDEDERETSERRSADESSGAKEIHENAPDESNGEKEIHKGAPDEPTGEKEIHESAPEDNDKNITTGQNSSSDGEEKLANESDVTQATWTSYIPSPITAITNKVTELLSKK